MKYLGLFLLVIGAVSLVLPFIGASCFGLDRNWGEAVSWMIRFAAAARGNPALPEPPQRLTCLPAAVPFCPCWCFHQQASYQQKENVVKTQLAKRSRLPAALAFN